MTGGLQLGNLSLASGRRARGAPWWTRRAVLDADFANDRYRFAGAAHSGRSTFLAVTGGVDSGSVITFGPYVAPDAPELIENGSFTATNLAGWSKVLNGSSAVNAVTNAAQLVSDGSTGTGGGGAGLTQPLETTAQRAYRATYKVSTATTNLRIGGTSSMSAGPAGGTRSPGTYTDTFSARAATSHFYAFRGPAGTSNITDISVNPCLPLKGMSEDGLTVEIEAVAPQTISTMQVVWSCGQIMTSDAGDEIQIVIKANGDVAVEARAESHVQAQLTLGKVEPGARFRVRAGFAKDFFLGQLDDGITLIDEAGTLVGFGIIRVGANFGGNAFTGEVERLVVHGDGGAETFYSLLPNLIRCEGDSFMSRVFGISLPTQLEAEAARTVLTTAVSNSQMPDIVSRIASPVSAHLRPRTTVIWDGSENPVESIGEVDAYCDYLSEAVSALGHRRFVIVPACANYGETDLAVSDAISDICNERWNGHIVDWRDHLDLDENGAPAANMFRDAETDQTHLSQDAMERMAAAIAAFIDAKGW